MNRISRFIVFLLPKAYTHCDIPCGIYDPHASQLAAHTVIRMVSLISELTPSSSEPPFEERKRIIHQIARYTKVKEEHAEALKHEIRVLWGDYFKEEHLKEYPDLHNLVFKTMKLASKARQEVNHDAAQELLVTVQKIAEIFFKTKGLTPVRVKSPYPTGGEIVLHK
ncbi:MAG: superoxide dismutase, Ni [Candidatus Levybacteria bacterium]|nr:superoxide dismutase, Ni [Candidatus Levybacteria bacterium]